jgi:hypothetical protein
MIATCIFLLEVELIHSPVPLRLRDRPCGAAPVAFQFLMDRRCPLGRLEGDDIFDVEQWVGLGVCIGLCPNRIGEFDSLPDFVTVVALPGKFGRFFSFSVAIMSRLRDVGWASL